MWHFFRLVFFRAASGEIMKSVHIFAIVFLSMSLVECIYAAPQMLISQKQGVNDLEPVFRDDTFVLKESDDEVNSTDIINKKFRLRGLGWGGEGGGGLRVGSGESALLLHACPGWTRHTPRGLNLLRV